MNYLIHQNILTKINIINTTDDISTNNISKVEYLFKSVINKLNSTNRSDNLFNSIKETYSKNPLQYNNFVFESGDLLKFYLDITSSNTPKKIKLQINIIDNNFTNAIYKI